jgi:chemotaxis signal transduction protein
VTNTDQTLEMGILADEVSDVVTVFKADIESPLITQASVPSEHLQGITADMLVVLNLNALLGDQRLIVQEEIM